MKCLTSILLAAAPLAACGSPEPAGDAPADTAVPAVDYVGRIRTLPAGQRSAVMLRAIRDAGHDCQTVAEVTEVTAQGGPATWAARCDNGGRWIVAIAPDGTARVADQAAMRGRG